MNKDKVCNPMPADDLVYTGHYIDHELVENIEDDCDGRMARKKAGKPMRFLLTIGGAGAQREIFEAIIKHLIPSIKAGKASLYINVGDYKGVREYLLQQIPEMKNLSTEHFDKFEIVKFCSEDALTGRCRRNSWILS